MNFSGLLAIAREPLWGRSKQLKSQLLRNFTFFISQCLQKQAFDACKTKKPAFRLAFQLFCGERGL
jgi:hypothetical protein